MIKKTIEYVDYNGNERVEDFYFHLSVPEATRLAAEFGATDGNEFSQIIQNIVAQQDFKKVIDMFDKIILTSYGQKSANGKSFIKSKEMQNEFENSQAYAELFEELVNDPDAATTFFEGIGAAVKKKSANAINDRN